MKKGELIGTFNFPTDSEIQVKDMAKYVLEKLVIHSNDVDCFVCGLEYGGKKRHPHLQLYIKFNTYPNRYDLMKKFRNVFGFSFTDSDVVWWFQFPRGDICSD